MHPLMRACIFVASVLAYVRALGDSLIADGVWEIHNIEKCENSDSYPLKFTVEKRKISRTQDGYNSEWDFHQAIDDTFAVKIDICKHVDGGCKDYQTLSDESVVNFVKKVAEENLRNCLAKAGIDPPDFPINPGLYEITQYELDKCEFPCKSVLGLFEASCFLISKDNEILACLKVTVEFREPECDEEICDRCRED